MDKRGAIIQKMADKYVLGCSDLHSGDAGHPHRRLLLGEERVQPREQSQPVLLLQLSVRSGQLHRPTPVRRKPKTDAEGPSE